MPACKKFRLAPLENEEDLEIMFSGASCTNVYAVIPGAKEGIAGAKEGTAGAEEGIAGANERSDGNDDEVEEVLPFSPPGANAKKRGAAHKSPMKKTKKNFRDLQFKRFVDSLWKKLVQASLPQLHLLMIMLDKR